tara:strand:- start:1012 stop:1665 length:654 start_codon:yes stop_codon:yes gene_type:complete
MKRMLAAAAISLAASFPSFADIVRTDNLVQNNGFFDGFEHWEIDYGNAVLGRNSNGPYVYGAGTANYAISQYIDLSSMNTSLIDSGSVSFTATHWQDSYIAKDFGYLRVAFLDENSNLISGFDGDVNKPMNWTKYDFSGAIPEGARSVRLRFIATRRDGNNLDAYFTNSALHLSADESDVAIYGDFNGVARDVPLSFAGALGLVMFGATRKRGKSNA